MSVILLIGGLLLAASLPGGETGSNISKMRITIERMEKIEAAMQGYMTANQHRPYPSSLTAAFDSASFGVSLAVPTTYAAVPDTHFTSADLTVGFDTVDDNRTITINSGTIDTLTKSWVVSGTGIQTDATNLSWVEGVTSTTTLDMNRTASQDGTNIDVSFRNPVVAGGVPVKTLGLSDEDAIDGFGRRIVYMVDMRTTVKSGCVSLQNNNLRGAVALSTTDTFSTGTYDNVMWALLSYGPDGQGAMGIQGAALSSRIKTANTDASTLSNAFYNSSQVTTYTNGGLVNKAPTSTFDDIVWVNEATKNTCAFGNKGSTHVSFKDFRIVGGDGAGTRPAAAYGDINGDGYKDIVLGVPQKSVVRVIFGRKDSWPDPISTYDTTSALDGNTGFTIAKGTVTAGFGATVAVGDVNGDGYDDVIAGSTTGGVGYAIVFGGSSWPATYTVGTTTTPTTAITIDGLFANTASHISVGDVNTDGYDDILLPFDSGSSNWSVGLIYGKTAANWASVGNFTLDDSFLTGDDSGNDADGVRFNVATPDASTGDISFGSVGGADLALRLTAICDANGDGYKDIILPGVKVDATISPQRMYVVLGQDTVWGSLSSGMLDVGTHASSKQLTFPTLAEGAAPTYTIKGLACGNMNGDTSGYNDALFYLKANAGSPPQEYLFTYLGRGTVAALNMNTTYDIRYDLTADAPDWQGTDGIPYITLGDVNNDGATDILLSRSYDDPNVSVVGSTFVINYDNSGDARTNAGITYVLFQPTSWGATPGLNKAFFNDYTYDGTDGFAIPGAEDDDAIITSTVFDMNKDKKEDLVIASGKNPTGGYLLFGKTAWPMPYDTHCMRDKAVTNCPAQIYAR